MQLKQMDQNTQAAGGLPTNGVESVAPAELPAALSYAIRERPLGTMKDIRVITIGAGASGLNMARALNVNTVNFTHTVYERNAGIGGTWYENRYPGCRCDVPSHNYQFSHTPNHGWTSTFADAKEINEYLEHVADKWDLRSAVKLSHSVQNSEWNEKEGLWHVEVKNETTGEVFEDTCHFLINATGFLNKWRWPDVKGLNDFKGELIHSARWPKEFDYKGKRVAVIGNGASALQIVPAIQPDAKEVINIFRNPTWVAPPPTDTPLAKQMIAALGLQIDEQGNFSAEQIEKFKQNPQLYMTFVKGVEAMINSRFKTNIIGSPEALMTQKVVAGYMAQMLNMDPKLMELAIPTYPYGTRRVTSGPGYLRALTKENVKVIRDEIMEFVPEGIKLPSGEIIEVDAIVCATGFDTSFVPQFPIIGEQGNLQDIWAQTVPEAYMSCMVAGVPNYFTILGPNSPAGHGSIFTITEHIAKYILKVIRKSQLEWSTSVRPLPDAVSDFSAHIQTFMPRTAWSSGGRSWFKAGKEEGPVIALHPGSRIHWFHMLELPRWEDFEWRQESTGEKKVNRFAYLGNGMSVREAPGANQTWYWDETEALWPSNSTA